MRLVVFLVADNKGPEIERQYDLIIPDEEFELPPSDFARRHLEPLANSIVIAARSLSSR